MIMNITLGRHTWDHWVDVGRDGIANTAVHSDRSNNRRQIHVTPGSLSCQAIGHQRRNKSHQHNFTVALDDISKEFGDHIVLDICAPENPGP